MKRFVRLMVALLVACVVSSCSITRELEQNASPIAFTEVNNYFVKNNSCQRNNPHSKILAYKKSYGDF